MNKCFSELTLQYKAYDWTDKYASQAIQFLIIKKPYQFTYYRHYKVLISISAGMLNNTVESYALAQLNKRTKVGQFVTGLLKTIHSIHDINI